MTDHDVAPPFTPGFFEDPFPTYAWLREHQPVAHIAPLNAYFVTRYDDCAALLMDNDNFKVGDQPVQQMWHPDLRKVMSTLFSDNPDHDRLRGVVADFFHPRSVRQREQAVEAIVNDAIADLVNAGESSVDLAGGFAFQVPIDVLSMLLGLQRSDYPLFHRWAPKLNSALEPRPRTPEELEESGAVAREVSTYLMERMAAGGLEPDGHPTVLSLLDRAVRDGVMSPDEVVPQAVQLYIGGHETTVHAIAKTLRALLLHPDQMAMVREDRSLIPAAVEEALRWDGISQVIIRRVDVEYELHGVTMPRNSALFISNGSANRDSAAFDKADTFDIGRPKGNLRLSFGKGLRFCLGAHVARIEIRYAVDKFLDAFPNAHLRPEDRAPRYNQNLILHGLASLRVQLH